MLAVVICLKSFNVVFIILFHCHRALLLLFLIVLNAINQTIGFSIRCHYAHMIITYDFRNRHSHHSLLRWQLYERLCSLVRGAH